jgi:hypothetical protein
MAKSVDDLLAEAPGMLRRRPGPAEALGAQAHDGGYEGTSSAAGRRLPGSPFNAPVPVRPAAAFAVHDQVTHDKYGPGVIVGVKDDAVLVDFRPHQRRVPLPCANHRAVTSRTWMRAGQ